MTNIGKKSYYDETNHCPICHVFLKVGIGKISYDVNTDVKVCYSDSYTLYYMDPKIAGVRYKERRFVYDTHVFYDSATDTTAFLPRNASKFSGHIQGKHIFADNLEEIIHNTAIIQ